MAMLTEDMKRVIRQQRRESYGAEAGSGLPEKLAAGAAAKSGSFVRHDQHPVKVSLPRPSLVT